MLYHSYVSFYRPLEPRRATWMMNRSRRCQPRFLLKIGIIYKVTGYENGQSWQASYDEGYNLPKTWQQLGTKQASKANSVFITYVISDILGGLECTKKMVPVAFGLAWSTTGFEVRLFDLIFPRVRVVGCDQRFGIGVEK